MKTHPAKTTLKPRKTPGQQRSTATVAAIVEAAARILEAKGFEGYTTNGVAEHAGVSIGSLYQYFPNKDAITRALIERETSLLLADVIPLEAEPDGQLALRGLLQSAVRHQLRRPLLARLLDIEEARLPMLEDIERIAQRIARVLRKSLQTTYRIETEQSYLIGDLLAIVKGMVDAAGQRGESDSDGLLDRVECAVYGYLEQAAHKYTG